MDWCNNHGCPAEQCACPTYEESLCKCLDKALPYLIEYCNCLEREGAWPTDLHNLIKELGEARNELEDNRK